MTMRVSVNVGDEVRYYYGVYDFEYDGEMVTLYYENSKCSQDEVYGTVVKALDSKQVEEIPEEEIELQKQDPDVLVVDKRPDHCSEYRNTIVGP